jgi:hypothetical protein
MIVLTRCSKKRSTQAPLQRFAGQPSEKLLAKTPSHYLADAGVDAAKWYQEKADHD